MSSNIKITGARAHNLKNLDLDLPKHKISVIIGPSGSGKTSLALDTLALEGKLRMLKIFDLAKDRYAKPYLNISNTTKISNLPPVIAFRKKITVRNRNTVASYFGLGEHLFNCVSATGTRICHTCGGSVVAHSETAIFDDIVSRYKGKLIALGAALPNGDDIQSVLQVFHDKGYSQVVFGNEIVDLDVLDLSTELLPKYNLCDDPVAIIVDRLNIESKDQPRLVESIRTALHVQQQGLVVAEILPDNSTATVLSRYAPDGLCQACSTIAFPLKQSDFTFRISGEPSQYAGKLEQLDPICNFTTPHFQAFGAIQLGSMTLSQVLDCEIGDLQPYLSGVLNNSASPSASCVLSLLSFLNSLGLSHLTLLRDLNSLSSGEKHRVRLAKQLVKPLSGIAYIIDEPSIGLHAIDRQNLFEALRKIRDGNNTVILVEHDRQLIEQSDYFIALGPGSGERGGKLLGHGAVDALAPEALDQLLRYSKHSPAAFQAKKLTKHSIHVKGATLNNLKDLSVSIPLNTFTCVTGVSGSGKSTLVFNTLLPAIEAHLKAGQVDGLNINLENIEVTGPLGEVVAGSMREKVHAPLSLVATYVDLFTPLRKFYANLTLAKIRGYLPQTFSLSSSANSGRCQYCKGTGLEPVDKADLAGKNHLRLPCADCDGQRYQREVLDVRFKGLSIADLLRHTFQEAASIIGFLPGCAATVETLERFNLAYLQLGQPTATLSNGEAQRLRLCKTLKLKKSDVLYLLDEPTSGLDALELTNLAHILHEVVQSGNTVIAIEHNLEFIKAAEHVIDMGPGAGSKGGEILFQGSVTEMENCAESVTGRVLGQA
ncbi:ATP-binding cassette domain-containing protein [Oligoflexia bacterium]|nr:ATP-binding cassette domain-containing protein [Oligoflexia bacterium]